MRQPIVIHPFLFALAPALFLFAYGSRKFLMHPVDLVLPCLLSLVLALVLLILGRVILRDWSKSGIATSAFILLFFLYGDVLDALSKPWPDLPPEVLLVLWVVLLGLVFWLLKRTRRKLDILTAALNVAAIAVVTLNVALSIPGLLRLARYQHARPNRQQSGDARAGGVCGACGLCALCGELDVGAVGAASAALWNLF